MNGIEQDIRYITRIHDAIYFIKRRILNHYPPLLPKYIYIYLYIKSLERGHRGHHIHIQTEVTRKRVFWVNICRKKFSAMYVPKKL